MRPDLDQRLDECLTLLREGRATIGECLARYPEQAAELEPLLESAEAVRRISHPTSSPVAFAAGKERMLAAVERRYARRQSWLGFAFGRPGKQRVLRMGVAVVLALVLCAATWLVLHISPQSGVVQAAVLTEAQGTVEVRPARRPGGRRRPATPSRPAHACAPAPARPPRWPFPTAPPARWAPKPKSPSSNCARKPTIGGSRCARNAGKSTITCRPVLNRGHASR